MITINNFLLSDDKFWFLIGLFFYYKEKYWLAILAFSLSVFCFIKIITYMEERLKKFFVKKP